MPTTTLIGTNVLGADYATDSQGVRDWLLANQARYVIRYIAGGGTWKHLTGPELEWLHANGIAVLLNHEGSATDAMKGESGGRTNGTKTRLVAETLGYPKDCPLFVSVDQDIYSANRVVAEAYVRGFAATCGYPLGVYGDDDICAAVDDLNPVVWLPNASGWTGTLDPRVQIAIRQRRALYPPGVDPNLTTAPVTAWLPTPEPEVPSMADIIPETGTAFDSQCTEGQTYTVELSWARLCIVAFEVVDPSAPGFITVNGNDTESVVNYGADVAAYNAVVGQTWFGACPDGDLKFKLGGTPGHTARVRVKLQGRG